MYSSQEPVHRISYLWLIPNGYKQQQIYRKHHNMFSLKKKKIN